MDFFIKSSGKTDRFILPLLLILYFTVQMTGQSAAKYASGMQNIINFYTILSYGCLVFRGLIWVLILARMNLITAYPLNGLSYLLILPVSFFIFGETISRERFIGALITSAGVACLLTGNYIVSQDKNSSEDPRIRKEDNNGR